MNDDGDMGICDRCKSVKILYPVTSGKIVAWVCLPCKKFVLQIQNFLTRLENIS